MELLSPTSSRRAIFSSGELCGQALELISTNREHLAAVERDLVLASVEGPTRVVEVLRNAIKPIEHALKEYPQDPSQWGVDVMVTRAWLELASLSYQLLSAQLIRDDRQVSPDVVVQLAHQPLQCLNAVLEQGPVGITDLNVVFRVVEIARYQAQLYADNGWLAGGVDTVKQALEFAQPFAKAVPVRPGWDRTASAQTRLLERLAYLNSALAYYQLENLRWQVNLFHSMQVPGQLWDDQRGQQLYSALCSAEYSQKTYEYLGKLCSTQSRMLMVTQQAQVMVTRLHLTVLHGDWLTSRAVVDELAAAWAPLRQRKPALVDALCQQLAAPVWDSVEAELRAALQRDPACDIDALRVQRHNQWSIPPYEALTPLALPLQIQAHFVRMNNAMSRRDLLVAQVSAQRCEELIKRLHQDPGRSVGLAPSLGSTQQVLARVQAMLNEVLWVMPPRRHLAQEGPAQSLPAVGRVRATWAQVHGSVGPKPANQPWPTR